jgi:hypothetical protein
MDKVWNSVAGYRRLDAPVLGNMSSWMDGLKRMVVSCRRLTPEVCTSILCRPLLQRPARRQISVAHLQQHARESWIDTAHTAHTVRPRSPEHAHAATIQPGRLRGGFRCIAPEFTDPALVIELVLTWERGKNLASWVLHHSIRVGVGAGAIHCEWQTNRNRSHADGAPCGRPAHSNQIANTDPRARRQPANEKPRNDARASSPSP